MEGRFDLIVLHLVLVLARLERDGNAGRGLGQELFDVFCRDLDGNLREMGVGDLAVPKHMRRFGEAFYGRQAAYLAAFAAPGDGELEKALARNIFRGADGARGAARLARYARAALRQFESQDEGALLRGEIVFPNPEALSMAERKSEDRKSKPNDRKSREFGPPPWHVPVAVEDIAETGQHFDLVADAGVRAAVAKLAGLRDLPRFEANFDLTAAGRRPARHRARFRDGRPKLRGHARTAGQ